MNHHHVFVYGTLKRGLYNARRMTDTRNGSSEFVCMARTVEKYPLVVATKWNVPYILDKPGHGHHVIGEVFRVDDKMLLFLEKLERLYRKDTIAIRTLEANSANEKGAKTEELQCVCFIFDNYKDKLLDLTYDEVYDPHGNPRHEFNSEKMKPTPENLKREFMYIEGEVLKDLEKQAMKDELLKAKTL